MAPSPKAFNGIYTLLAFLVVSPQRAVPLSAELVDCRRRAGAAALPAGQRAARVFQLLRNSCRTPLGACPAPPSPRLTRSALPLDAAQIGVVVAICCIVDQHLWTYVSGYWG